MKKIMVAVALVFVFVFGYAVAKSMANDMTSGSSGASDVSKLIGKTVQNFQGDDLGTISEFVKGPEGRIAFAMLSYWVSDNTRKMIAVPIGALSCGEQNCVLNACRETVRTTPTFASMDDLGKRRTAVDIYLYFGVQPYWTEEGTTGRK
jgi:hypothetical protein